ncbi:hypothetical protein SAMN04489806_1424 [Paramicrobacterium humi]|uniref:SpoVT-AbrB domain-containing protein n=2 Tax=Paramicrobacterium humi TaxID=640635 RepID=A0A1H4L5Q3_9MICO|nr:hypothetical protein SAMN04489806_1424 [Microbacterium humi]
MDKAGRIVVPLAIRQKLGFEPGPVDISVEGTSIRIEVPTSDRLEEKDGRLVIATEGEPLSIDAVREIRRADQR